MAYWFWGLGGHLSKIYFCTKQNHLVNTYHMQAYGILVLGPWRPLVKNIFLHKAESFNYAYDYQETFMYDTFM